jgi:hypothetical protein
VAERGEHRRAGFGEQLGDQLRVLVQQLLRQPEVHRHRHHPGLGAVMQVALDAPQLRRLHVDHPAPGPGEHIHPVDERALAVGRQAMPDPAVQCERDAQA